MLSFCSGEPTVWTPLEAAETRKPLRIVCTILPIYVLTLNVVGRSPGVQVDLLLPAHQGCPHNYDLTPGDLLKMVRADLIVANGLGLEGFLDQVSRKTRQNKIPILYSAEKIQPISNRPVQGHFRIGQKAETGGHDHQEKINGHAWVSPKAAAVMVRTIADGLIALTPQQATEFRANAERYARKLEDLSEAMKGWVTKARNNRVLAFHDDLAYFARDIGLNIVGVVQVQAGIEPSSRELARLMTLIKDRQVAALFSEPQYSDKVVRTLSRETGIPFFELDPLATGNPRADAYERAMEKNYKILQKALK